MYKIFINNTPLLLTDNLSDPLIIDTLKNHPENTLLLNWDNIPEMILYAIEVLEKNNDLDYIILFGDNIEKLKNAFWSFYQYQEAAGGVVLNEASEILMIYRYNKWDLPKGKINEGEKAEDAAVREVQEETGLQHIEIVKPVHATYHTFLAGGKRQLKCTHWYRMTAGKPLNLKLQAEENITDAKWVERQDIAGYLSNSYKSIGEILLLA